MPCLYFIFLLLNLDMQTSFVIFVSNMIIAVWGREGIAGRLGLEVGNGLEGRNHMDRGTELDVQDVFPCPNLQYGIGRTHVLWDEVLELVWRVGKVCLNRSLEPGSSLGRSVQIRLETWM